MTTEMTQHGGSELALGSDQTFWTPNQRAVLSQLGVNRASEEDLAVFFHQAQRTGLDPFAKQIYMIERQGKQTIQTGIDGFRLIARRTIDRTHEDFGYRPTLWCGRDGQWRDVWLENEPPAAAKVVVVRGGQEFDAIALFESYAGRKRDGNLNSMWSTQGAHMIAKCAEALALRKAFPQDLSGLYTADEMAQADNSQTITSQVQRPRPQQQAQRQGSGRDWLAELDQCATAEDARKLYAECSAARELTKEIAEQITTAGRTLAATESLQSDEGEVVDGQLIDDDGVIQDNAA
ncbi:phage recombination protein Bet [Brevibacterium oceani]|uniref:phage recombination protein Bet n=1 Tax=Brevibacterium oceani TaxID=358099 RepID=UPI0015E695D2|nr:phage recombination protein Bet [Brevibacterium oceani]